MKTFCIFNCSLILSTIHQKGEHAFKKKCNNKQCSKIIKSTKKSIKQVQSKHEPLRNNKLDEVALRKSIICFYIHLML